MFARMIFGGLMLGALAGRASAQTFPAGGWLPLTQKGLLGDPFDGNPPYVPAIDIVGDKSNPAALVSADANYMYFRLLLAGSPYNIVVHHYYGYLWACLLDTDENPQTYELLAGLDGLAVTRTVDLDRNTSTATPDDIGDPVESTLATYDTAFNAQYAPSGSTLGGGVDYFLDWAVAWSDLATAGFVKGNSFRLVCGTSTSATNMSGGDVLDGGTGSKSFSADASDAMLCGDSGCRYDAVFKDGFEGR